MLSWCIFSAVLRRARQLRVNGHAVATGKCLLSRGESVPTLPNTPIVFLHPPSPSLPTTAPAPSPQFIGHAGGYYSLIKRTCYPWQTHKWLAVLSLNEALTSSVNPRFPKWGPGTSRGPSVRAFGIGTTDFKFHNLHCSCHRTGCLQV